MQIFIACVERVLRSNSERDSSQHHPEPIFKNAEKGKKLLIYSPLDAKKKGQQKGEFPRTPSLVIIIPFQLKLSAFPTHVKWN